MLSGLVPLSTDVGDSKLILNKYGILIKPNDEKELKKSIQNLIKYNFPENYKKNMIDFIKKNYNNDKMLKNYEKLYNNIIDEK